MALGQKRNGPGICSVEALQGGLTLQLQHALSLKSLLGSFFMWEVFNL